MEENKSSNAHKIILSLCDYTGNWPHFYREAGYDVRLIDLKHGFDVRLLEYIGDGWVYGILAAPDCSKFATSGNGARAREKKAGTYEDAIKNALALVDACIRAVMIYRKRLKFWSLENPVGTLHRWLGPPTFAFDPCDYGDPYTKRTLLWGDFVPPLPLFNSTKPVEPVRVSAQGSWVQKLGGSSEKTKEKRSTTPLGFAQAFFEANR